MKTLKSDPPDTVSIPRISVIIPARNDAAALGQTLDYLDGLVRNDAVEVIVAASGDPGGTERAVAGRAKLLWPSGSTRSTLMNAGAETARGEILFFLHADSFPPASVFELIDQALSSNDVAGGAFEHLFVSEPPCSAKWTGTRTFGSWKISNSPSASSGLDDPS